MIISNLKLFHPKEKEAYYVSNAHKFKTNVVIIWPKIVLDWQQSIHKRDLMKTMLYVHIINT